MDTTYFGRSFGLMVFMDNLTSKVLYYEIVHYETNDLYRKGIAIIQSQHIDIKSITCAYRSLRNNTNALFVYQNDDDKNIPNTTNKLEGLFSELKRQLNCHKGLNKQRKLLFINGFLFKRMA